MTKFDTPEENALSTKRYTPSNVKLNNDVSKELKKVSKSVDYDKTSGHYLKCMINGFCFINSLLTGGATAKHPRK